MTTELTWQDPPPSRPASVNFKDVQGLLKERPGTWALVHANKSNSIGTYVRKALGDGYEVTTRRVDGTTDVYARYVGDEGR